MVELLVKAGEKAVLFNYLSGSFSNTFNEGYHLRLPFITRAVVYEVRTRYLEENAQSANKDLQNIDFQYRILYRPDPNFLAQLTERIGTNYSEKIVPSISKEVAKTVIAKYNAQQLLSNREQVSADIKTVLKERLAQFYIHLEDVAITQISFSKEFEKSVEEKQIAQQHAERMKYTVERAKEIKKQSIIMAEQESKSVELIGKAMQSNPSYLSLRKLDITNQISEIISKSNNKIVLNSDQLLMNTLN